MELLAVNGGLDELGNSRKVVVLSGVFLDLSWICVIPGSGRDWPEGPWASTSWSDLWKNCTSSFSFAGIVWVMVLFLLPVVFQTKVARLTALVYLPGMVVRTEKGRCFVVTLVSEWGDGMYHVTCWVTLACGLLCTFVVSSETEACPAGTSVGSLRDSSKSWGIVLALGLRARAGGEQDGSVRLMLMERCSCAGSTLKWK